MNNGIIVSGGSFAASQVAVGQNAVVEVSGVQNREQIHEHLKEIISLVEASKLPVDSKRSLIRAASDVMQGVETQPSDKSKIATAMDALTKSGPMLAGVAALIAAISGLIV